MNGLVLDAFAGPGGWDEGAKPLGLAPVGIEWDAAACRTGKAAGHTRVRADVATFPLDHLAGQVTGLIMSPPCQDFSLAGKQAGIEGDKGQLIREVLRWTAALRPRWVACEQVPPCLPIWTEYAERMRAWGYRTWVGVVNAADYGVPQTRKRAILLASLDRQPTRPDRTHAKGGDVDLFAVRAPWVSMAQALGWGMTDRPTNTVVAGHNRSGGTAPLDGGSGSRKTYAREREAGRWVYVNGTMDNAARRPATEPAPTVMFGYASNDVRWAYDRPATVVGSFYPDVIAAPGYRTDVSRQDAPGSVRVTVQEAGILQSFPPDYPWDGLAPAPHVAQGLAVEDHLALAHQLVADGLQRGVHLTVRGLPWKHDEVLQSVVVLDAVDVVHDLLRLRVGDDAVLRYQRTAGEDVAPVDAEVSSLLPALVRVERVTSQPPLLPVLGAEAARDGFAFAVEARWLGRTWRDGVSGAARPNPLVVHEAHALRAPVPLTTIDLAYAHRSCYRAAGSSRTKQYEQCGNAVPPRLATHLLAEVMGVRVPAELQAAA